VAFGKKLQVTYEGRPLYTFTSDHGKSVTGNGVNGFAVAEVAPPAS
jgi:predicted lipoprotein with Yx(FWY)xxD motif